jgi:hypothetical protein
MNRTSVERCQMPQIAAVIDSAMTAASLAGVPFSPRCCLCGPAGSWVRRGSAPTNQHYSSIPVERQEMQRSAAPKHQELGWLFGEMALIVAHRDPAPVPSAL